MKKKLLKRVLGLCVTVECDRIRPPFSFDVKVWGGDEIPVRGLKGFSSYKSAASVAQEVADEKGLLFYSSRKYGEELDKMRRLVAEVWRGSESDLSWEDFVFHLIENPELLETLPRISEKEYAYQQWAEKMERRANRLK